MSKFTAESMGQTVKYYYCAAGTFRRKWQLRGNEGRTFEKISKIWSL
jgi:hypothetical protein